MGFHHKHKIKIFMCMYACTHACLYIYNSSNCKVTGQTRRTDIQVMVNRHLKFKILRKVCMNETGGKFKKFLLYSRHVTFDVQHATTDVKHETYNILRQTCNLSRKVCNFDVKHKTNENIREYSLFWLYSRHATSNVKHATPTSNMQQ